MASTALRVRHNRRRTGEAVNGPGTRERTSEWSGVVRLTASDAAGSGAAPAWWDDCRRTLDFHSDYPGCVWEPGMAAAGEPDDEDEDDLIDEDDEDEEDDEEGAEDEEEDDEELADDDPAEEEEDDEEDEDYEDDDEASAGSR